MPTVVKTFVIPTPTIIDPDCEWFRVRWRETYPGLGSAMWTTEPDIHSNSFNLTLETEKIYQIEAIHHCCDDSESNPKSISFSTITTNTPIYVLKVETLLVDTCAVTPGSCRNCTVTWRIRMDFFADAACTLPLDVTGRGLKIKTQINRNSVAAPEVQSPVLSGTSYAWGDLIKYEETCTMGLPAVVIKEVFLLNGIGEIVPYIAVGTPVGVNGVINLTSGTLPVDIATPNASGTINAANGSTVHARISCAGLDAGAYAVGSINGVPFFANNTTPYNQTIIMPITGVVSWNIHLVTTQIGQTATLQLI